jgi:hypothetical protein
MAALNSTRSLSSGTCATQQQQQQCQQQRKAVRCNAQRPSAAAAAAAAPASRSALLYPPAAHQLRPAPAPRDTRAQGLFDGVQGLFGGGPGAAAAAGGFAEKPAYPKKDMLKIGPLDVSPMGLGTWSW